MRKRKDIFASFRVARILERCNCGNCCKNIQDVYHGHLPALGAIKKMVCAIQMCAIPTGRGAMLGRPSLIDDDIVPN